MSHTAMSAPSRASARAWLRPCPRAPPVISATRPSNRPIGPPSCQASPTPRPPQTRRAAARRRHGSRPCVVWRPGTAIRDRQALGLRVEVVVVEDPPRARGRRWRNTDSRIPVDALHDDDVKLLLFKTRVVDDGVAILVHHGAAAMTSARVEPDQDVHLRTAGDVGLGHHPSFPAALRATDRIPGHPVHPTSPQRLWRSLARRRPRSVTAAPTARW